MKNRKQHFWYSNIKSETTLKVWENKVGLDLGFGHSTGPKMHFLVFGTWKQPAMREKNKIISSVDYVSLLIRTANFDVGGVFFLFCLYKRWANADGVPWCTMVILLQDTIRPCGWLVWCTRWFCCLVAMQVCHQENMGKKVLRNKEEHQPCIWMRQHGLMMDSMSS